MQYAEKMPATEQVAIEESSELIGKNAGRTGLRLVAPEIIPVAEAEETKSTEPIEVPEYLSSTQANYYRLVSTLIDSPNFAFIKADAGAELTALSGMDPKQWYYINQKLRIRYNVIGVIKRDDLSIAKFPKGVYLNVQGLLHFAGTQRSRFITNEMLLAIKGRIDDEDITDLLPGHKDEYKKQIDELLSKRARRKPRFVSEEDKLQRKAEREAAKAARHLARQEEQETKRQQRVLEKESAQARKALQQKEKRDNERRKASATPDFLRFQMPINGKSATLAFRKNKFIKLNPHRKALLAIGHSSTFTDNLKQQEAYALRILNKFMDPEEHYSEEQTSLLLDELKKQELILTNHNHLSISISARELFMPSKKQTEELTLGEVSATEFAESQAETGDEGSDEETTENADKIYAPTINARFRFIDDILHYRGLDEVQAQDWHLPSSNKFPLPKELDNALDLADKNIVLRLDDLEEVGFAQSQINSMGERINLKFTKEGIDFWKAHQSELIDRGILVDEKEIELFNEMLQTCKELAVALEEKELFASLEMVEFNFGDLEPYEIKQELARVEKVLDQLRKDYALAFAANKAR
jgi:hypothetical protein